MLLSNKANNLHNICFAENEVLISPTSSLHCIHYKLPFPPALSLTEIRHHCGILCAHGVYIPLPQTPVIPEDNATRKNSRIQPENLADMLYSN